MLPACRGDDQFVVGVGLQRGEALRHVDGQQKVAGGLRRQRGAVVAQSRAKHHPAKTAAQEQRDLRGSVVPAGKPEKQVVAERRGGGIGGAKQLHGDPRSACGEGGTVEPTGEGGEVEEVFPAEKLVGADGMSG